MQLPNDNAFVTLLFALLRLGVIPVLAMPSQRALDIDALIELAQPVAYVIHGENHAELARQMAHKHACLRHVLVAGETVSDDFTPLFSLHGERQAWPQPDVSATALLLLSGGTTGTPKLIPRRHADYSYNFSASAELCGISQQSVYLAVLPVAHNFPLACPGILGTLACGGKVVLTDSASCDGDAFNRAGKSDSRRPGSGAGAIMGAGQGVGRQRPFVAARHSGRRRPARPDAC